MPTILAFFLHHEPLTEEEAYTWSLKVEPRDTSEGYEQLLMEDLQLRRDMEQLQVRNSDLEVCRRDSTWPDSCEMHARHSPNEPVPTTTRNRRKR